MGLSEFFASRGTKPSRETKSSAPEPEPKMKPAVLKPPIISPIPKPHMETATSKPPRQMMPGRDTQAPAPAGHERTKTFAVDRKKMFNLVGTQKLHELFKVAREARTAAWSDAFFPALWNASLQVAEPPMFQGPDYFSYIRLQIPAAGVAFDSNSVSNLAEQAVQNATGIAIFASPASPEPEYVLNMGLLDSLLRYDSWQGDPADLAKLSRAHSAASTRGGLQTITTGKEAKVLVGAPAESFLPAYTAHALYNHLTQGWNLTDPRVALMVHSGMAPTRSLVIGRKLSQFPDPETAGVHCRFLLWYFPPRRSLLLMPESWKLEDMRPLTDFFPQPKKPSES